MSHWSRSCRVQAPNIVSSVRASLLLALAGIVGTAHAQTASSTGPLAGVVVVGSTPLIGSDLDSYQVPVATQVLGASDINRTGIPDFTGAVLANVPSATINDDEGNVFQPDILFRGFTASPVAGTPEGLAVYVNGARFNDAFGDTVNWDLIPPSAIETVSLEGSNPIFGLNALGGSVNVRLKNGFTNQTADITAYGGSYGREAAILEYGQQSGPFAVYVAADVTHDDGFRQTSTSNLHRLYADLGWRSDVAELHLDITAAHDRLGNPGATPIQALAVNISDIFTAPNVVDNTYLGFNLNGSYKLSDTISLQSVAYFQTLNQVVPNGITEDVAPCGDGLLCNSDGTVVTGPNGKLVTNFLDGATYSGLSVQQLDSHAYGTSVQVTDTASLAGHANHFVAGLSFDGSDSIFAGVQEIGGFNPYTREYVGPGVIQDQSSEGVNPVRVRSVTSFYGLFATDVLTLAPHLDFTVAGRFNDAQIDLTDELGGPVNGAHTYDRFNPSAGLTYSFSPRVQIYGSYSESNRAPTPEELSCASAASPCSLLNFFVGDPNLNQVVAHTFEFGIRGRQEELANGQLNWNVDAYHTENTNDIIYETTVYNPNLAFYTNAGRTLRQGLEASLHFDTQRLHATLGYAYTDATFRTPVLLNTGSPAANAAGEEQVLPGDRIPGIPRNRVNFVVECSLTNSWSLGGSAVSQSGAYRFGDEANLTQPLAGYTLVDLDTAIHAGNHVTLFAVVNNALNRRYDTYGTFGPLGAVPWPNVPGGVTDPRTDDPGTPRTVYGGVRVTF
jgi:outer membrane receptor protein involved in Fe transport